MNRVGLFLLSCFVVVALRMTVGQVTDQHLQKPDPNAWLMYSGSYDSQRHSPLRQISPDNVKELRATWVYHMEGQAHVQAVPIVADGVMYVSQFNRLDALDARTGSLVWQYQKQPVTRGAQRGTAVYGHKVFVTSSDSTLMALDSRTGALLWETKSAGGWRLAGQAPLIARGRVIVSGNQPSGFIQAYDAETGKHLWTWNAIPQKPGAPGSETWAGDSFKLGGGPVWVSGSYDPALNTLFYGTGQPGSQWAGETREGDNLYSNCIVAIDADTGQLKWYFQNTPHDVHDWDSLEIPILLDTQFRGQLRKLLLQANRNGFFYVLDRTNGRFLHGAPFISKLNWASGLSPEGRPILVPGIEPSVEGSKTCPSTAGATNWPSPAYNPGTGLFYLIAQEGCGLNFRVSNKPGAGGSYLESPHEGEEWQLFVRALDGLTGKTVWDYKQVGSFHYGPGVLSTAGGVLFAGEHKGQLTALDARKGSVLWNFNTGALITSSPISYGVNGQQYIAISSGPNVFAFSLPAAR